jgi:hypothetical protein
VQALVATSLGRQEKLSYAFIVTVCRFKVSGLIFKMATGCAVGKYLSMGHDADRQC